MLFSFVKTILFTAALAKAIPLDEELFGRSMDLGSKFHDRDAEVAQAGDPEGNGFHSGYFYSFWSDGRRFT